MTTPTANPVELLTESTIAKTLRRPRRDVTLALRRNPNILPVAIAGRTKVYDYSAIDMIRFELVMIDARRKRRKAVARGR